MSIATAPLKLHAFDAGPLADTQDLGPEIAAFASRTVELLKADSQIPDHLRASMEGRLRQLKHESIRQSLVRLCNTWFPADPEASDFIEYVYALRSEILHNGTVSDQDVLLGSETRKVRQYIRQVIEQEFNRTFRVSTAV